jgi:anti-sigma factor RsiW
MSCTLSDFKALDLKAYAVGEVTKHERGAVEDHVRGCQSCREELDRLNLTRSALASLEDEEIPRRIAFVSDRVFEPRWWQTMWHSGPVMGFASASLLSVAILAHGFARPVVLAGGSSAGSSLDAAQIERRVEAQVTARVDAAVTKAVNEAEAKQTAEFAKVLKATERQRQADLANFQQAAEYYQKQVGRFEVASNEGAGQ